MNSTNKFILLLLSAALMIISCSANGPSPTVAKPKPPVKPDGTPVAEQITVSLGAVTDNRISDRLLGFNTVYAKNPDAIWSDGKLANAIKAVKPGFLRYPGGTVTTYYHWNALTGNGWEDSWDPSYNTATNKKKSEFMDLDEYLSLIRQTGALPMLGINCNSGFVHNRIEEGIAEALALMKYVKDKGFDVKYWFIGNEPFAKDGNGGNWTPAEYAEMVKTFAKPMKEYDPSIKIIVNDHANMKKNGSEYKTILQIAGQWIDVIDVHWYWNHGTASWENWLKKTPCGISGGNSYEDEVDAMHELASGQGYPNLEFASLEWNCGPSTGAAVPFETAGQITLIQGEMIMQFMRGGLDFACFWPLFWDGDYGYRSMIDKSSRKLLPVADVMADYGPYQGSRLVKTSLSKSFPNVLDLAAKSDDGTVRYVFLNKNNYSIGLGLTGAGLDESAQVEVKSYVMDASLRNIIMQPAEAVEASKIRIEPYSLTFVTVGK